MKVVRLIAFCWKFLGLIILGSFAAFHFGDIQFFGMNGY